MNNQISILRRTMYQLSATCNDKRNEIAYLKNQIQVLASLRLASLRLASLRLAPPRIAPARIAPARLAPSMKTLGSDRICRLTPMFL